MVIPHCTTARNLTSPDPDLGRLIGQTHRGMAHWAGTCADPKAICGDCAHYGYTFSVRDNAGNTLCVRKRGAACGLYRKLCGRHGETFPRTTAACKYFEPRSSS